MDQESNLEDRLRIRILKSLSPCEANDLENRHTCPHISNAWPKWDKGCHYCYFEGICRPEIRDEVNEIVHPLISNIDPPKMIKLEDCDGCGINWCSFRGSYSQYITEDNNMETFQELV